MRVFKFGGASISSIERIQNVKNILKNKGGEDQLLIVISAMGKTTNALEKVVDAFFNHDREQALALFEKIKKDHITLSKYLLVTHYLQCETRLKDFFTEAEWLLYDNPVQSYNYYYDQLVCIGELLSTTIISFYLNEMDVNNTWVDVRDIIRTDSDFRNAKIDWAYSQAMVTSQIKPLLNQSKIVSTQGFIGATDENESTTLGREGSDYTAAIFTNMLDAESLTIWKDVESVMNADPRQVPDAIPITELNYTEVIEMAYYGAQVIHPKTIKPLQNKSIPLYVKCFLNPDLHGTIIHNKIVKELPPIIVFKNDQVMMELKTKDFSFVGDRHTSNLYELFEKFSINPNLTQTDAINIITVLDNREEKINKLAAAAAEIFDVQLTPGLALLTIRHYNDEVLDQYTKEKDCVIKQQTKKNLRILYWPQV